MAVLGTAKLFLESKWKKLVGDSKHLWHIVMDLLSYTRAEHTICAL